MSFVICVDTPESKYQFGSMVSPKDSMDNDSSNVVVEYAWPKWCGQLWQVWPTPLQSWHVIFRGGPRTPFWLNEGIYFVVNWCDLLVAGRGTLEEERYLSCRPCWSRLEDEPWRPPLSLEQHFPHVDELFHGREGATNVVDPYRACSASDEAGLWRLRRCSCISSLAWIPWNKIDWGKWLIPVTNASYSRGSPLSAWI